MLALLSLCVEMDAGMGAATIFSNGTASFPGGGGGQIICLKTYI
jgi:hypothetical protein